MLNHSVSDRLPGGICDYTQYTPMWYKTETSPLEIADRAGPVGCQMTTVTSCWSLSPGRLSCLQQLCLLRPHIPAGQTHSTLITCANLRVGHAQSGALPLTFHSFYAIKQVSRNSKHTNPSMLSSNKHNNANINLSWVLCNCEPNKRWSGAGHWRFMGQCTERDVLSLSPAGDLCCMCFILLQFPVTPLSTLS